MKRWQIVYGLPLEVWVEIFSYPWITHAEFGQLVDKIGNFKFAEHAQFFLHEWGKRTLDMNTDWVHFDEKGLSKNVGYESIYLDIPQTPLPPNIRKYLGRIQIWHFDAKTVDFLGRIRPLLTDLCIIFCANPRQASTRIILSHLAPLLDRIHLLSCKQNVLPVAKQCFGDKFAQIKVLAVSYYRTESPMPTFDIVMDWLIQPEQGGVGNGDGPRFCELQNTEQFFKQIHTAQFLAASTPSTFALNLIHHWKKLEFAEFHLENGIGEHLHGKWIERKADNKGTFQITRHGADWSTEELQEWAKEAAADADNEGRRCRIGFDLPTVGLVLPKWMCKMDEGQAEKQQPFCSKDA